MSKGIKYSIILVVSIGILFAMNLLQGSVSIPAGEVWRILLGDESVKPGWSFIVWESRLPQALTALLCGAALSTCGLMLQTAFRNPLAGTSILGINSGCYFVLKNNNIEFIEHIILNNSLNSIIYIIVILLLKYSGILNSLLYTIPFFNGIQNAVIYCNEIVKKENFFIKNSHILFLFYIL